ncbi:MAG: histidine--tRNA ligase [Peptoniphilus harei]|uniref:Histidine--tRNA ligase n=1 Tax=Peptoniphilus genitalis TaxID=3036303 RepID=A0ABY4TNQ9_9FIRM|nr:MULTISPECIES: histidine--tRNA ligase [Peptoniphilus]MDK7354196.1 histidine--tRNA ligase [Peptoniphilus harei]MDK7370176.1 histidine--tRNA ligase [Peptoniphilus harei]MDK7754865.1 histidine--tRNA ligase [Peptoniphilus harei]MDK7760671.1 histidine--tRNA ligase [Peptoniphilus harei]MDK8270462.1 histidine--tRNA ligase [Peptoniphilus harei]
MTIVKPSTLPGFMELLPKDQILFNEMKDIIRKNFEKHGFLPIDTPVIEKSEVLLAKGGGETEKQIYRFSKGDTDMSLRFDLTVPLARYTVEHMNDLSFPFKRYQIGKVYRGEKAQKGRFREFYQCDIDTIGMGELSLVNDAEFPVVIFHTFKDLGFTDFTIHLNNRKILKGFFSSLGIEDSMNVLRTVDKLDKIGEESVLEELGENGIGRDSGEKILEFIKIKGTVDEILEQLRALKIEDEIFQEGLDELTQVVGYMRDFGIDEDCFDIDLKIARGLDYYTGTVYETTLDNYPKIGSVCSGGRYEDLASYYTDKALPGVGISIGLSRLFYQLNEAKIISSEEKSLVDLLIIPMDDCIHDGIKLLSELREKGVRVSVYTEFAKLKKKFKYADQTKVDYVIVLGEEEIKTRKYSLKDMKTGDQEEVTFDELVERFKK